LFTIVGSGFGLYGYLPVLVEGLGVPVLLPRSYQPKLLARPELHRYLEAIRWASDADAALSAASGVVIATRPSVQPRIVADCCRRPALGMLVLEKPLAVDPHAADEVLDHLRRSGKAFRIGYTFLETDWGRDLISRKELAGPSWDLHISWRFMAHHFAHDLASWKRSDSEGGGALRFFGIHVLALLARLGYVEVEESSIHGRTREELEKWEAAFSGPGLPNCLVHLDSRSDEQHFVVELGHGGASRRLVNLGDPFETAPLSGRSVPLDRRVGVLERLLGTFRAEDASAFYHHYSRANSLWARAEAVSVFCPIHLGSSGQLDERHRIPGDA
jgi:predicted dehydrogenase